MPEVAPDCEHQIEVDANIESGAFRQDIDLNGRRLVPVDRFKQERMRDPE